MIQTLTHTKLNALLCCVFATGLALWGQLCSANEHNLGDALDFSFNKAHTHNNTMNITPISAMSNETLFLAAAAERSNLMHPNQRKANYQWLSRSGAQYYTGFAALRKLLTLSFLTYVPALNLGQNNKQASATNTPNTSQFANLNNYRLDYSSDSISLGFQYRF